MPGLLVADDIAIIRSTVGKIVAHEKLDLQPVVEARNGEEAVNLARQMRPDIVLMDIKMPGLDGLQATSIIRAEHPTAKIIMLTAYDEFVYAQQALQLGAVDYLLKPIRPAKLVAALAQTQAQLRQERQQQREVEATRVRLQRTLPMVEAGLVENLIRGLATDQTANQETLASLSKTMATPAVMVVEVDPFNSPGRSRAAAALSPRFGKLLSAAVRGALAEPIQALIGHSWSDQVVVIVSTAPHLTTTDQMRALGETMRRTVEVNTSVTVTVSIGHGYPDLESVPISYAEATLAKRCRRSQAGNMVIHIDDIRGLDECNGLRYPLELERNLLDSVRLNQFQASLKLIEEMGEYLLGCSAWSAEVVYDQCAKLMALVARAVIDAGASSAQILDLSQKQVMTLASLSSVTSARTWLLNSLTELMAAIEPASQQKSPVQQAIEYIHANLHRPDITVKDVAGAVNLSPSHLAYLLKAKLGVSYVKYLTLVRIEQAKKLLCLTDLSISTVAEMVGYQNLTNFYRLFQRETNVTPAAYRRSIQT
jgi:two-component system response regulator YesN